MCTDRYKLRIPGIYSVSPSVLETGASFPNPFLYSVHIPVIISVAGDIQFAVYDLSGRKIKEIKFPSVVAGSYRIVWDGCNQNGSPQGPGLYIYAISFHDRTYSGRLLKSSGVKGFSGSTYIEPFLLPPLDFNPAVTQLKIPLLPLSGKKVFTAPDSLTSF